GRGTRAPRRPSSRGRGATEHQGAAVREAIIVDSGANLASLQYALERLGARARVSADGSTIASAERVVLPGVRAAGGALGRRREDPLLEGIAEREYVYFVHTYAAAVSEHTLASTDYGGSLSAVVRRGNFWGTQFHPDRSGRTGARLLGNFLRL